jgi:hypothetical protein
MELITILNRCHVSEVLFEAGTRPMARQRRNRHRNLRALQEPAQPKKVEVLHIRHGARDEFNVEELT